MSCTYRRTVGALLAAILVTQSAGCTTGRVNQRVAYWSKTTAERLPPGSTLQDAKNLFSAAGLEFVCCVSAGPDLKRSWYAREPRDGRFLWTVYDVVVLVQVTPDDRIAHLEVQRWGVGL